MKENNNNNIPTLWPVMLDMFSYYYSGITQNDKYVLQNISGTLVIFKIIFTFAVTDLLETANLVLCENKTFDRESLLKHLVDRLIL